MVAIGVVAGLLACHRGGADARPSEHDERANSTAQDTGGATRGQLAGAGLPGLGKVLAAGDPGPVDLTLEIQVDREARPISPLIYGLNFHGRAVGSHGFTVLRSGGNRSTAYNWENNASNAGSDFQFQNDGFLGDSDAPALPLLQVIDAAGAISAASVITISNSDYVAADKAGGGDVRKSGANYLSTRFKRNRAKKPTAFAAMPDRDDDSVYQDELVFFLKSQRPKSALLFSMDNEPDLWTHTHAEIFSKPVTYAELWRRNHDFAKAAKQVWPSAEVLGFVSYGYLGYVSLQDAPDADHRNFLDWYLEQARAAEKTEGMRLIDYLDLHWYPEAQGGGKRVVGDDIDTEVVTAREQAPRSLWDKRYQEVSWVRDAAGGPIDLLHWVQGKIDAHYPGTKIAISEWNFGGGKHISGAIATADVLGVFGRHGVGLATYWPLSEEEPYAFSAFDVFRNFDSAGGRFGDTSVAASSSDTKTATVYASIDSHQPTRTVVVAINKAFVAKKAGIKIRHASVYGTAKTYVLSQKSSAVVPAASLKPAATNAFVYEMPAQSISIIVPQL